MEILLNSKPADIILNTEKTLGDVLSGIELWISSTGNRISKIYADGKEISGQDLEKAFDWEIKNITKLEIYVSLWRDLAIEALETLLASCTAWEDTPFDERKQIVSAWVESPAARFLTTDIGDLSQLAGLFFSGEGLSAGDLTILIEERLRELKDPNRELGNAEVLVKTISERMEELPLDMQTGKDQRAAETILLFSRIAEKLFRVFFIFKSEGLSMDDFTIDDLPAATFISEFNAALLELSAAYENQDIVLAGDVAEYELAPRISKLYIALKLLTNSHIPVISKP